MRITFYGAAQEVTGSMHLIEVNGQRILLECGLYQGPRAETYDRNLNLPFDAASIDTVVLSHAHIDHSGNLPNLVKQGYTGTIWCTAATRNLCAYMLMDSGHIHEMDVEYVNQRRARRGEPPVEPLYTRADAQACLEQFVGVGLHRPLTIGDGVKLTYYTQHLRALASARTSMGRAITNRERALRAAAAADAERAERAAAMAEYERQVADRQEALRRGEAVPPVPVPEHMGERMRPGAN